MKRTAIALLVLLLSVTVVSAVGCGGSGGGGDSSYKELEAKAAALYETAQANWDILYAKIKQANTDTEQLIMNAMGGTIASIPPEKRTGLSDATRALLAECDSVQAEFEALNSPEFRKSKGIDAYALYAAAMTKAIGAYKQLLELGAGFLSKIEPALASGDTAAINAAIQGAMADVTQIQEALKNSDAALAEADKVKTSEQLGVK